MTNEHRHARFLSLLRDHERIIFKVAATYCSQVDDRRDLEQEICVQLWRAFPAYDETRAFPTWMYRIALNVAIAFVRKSSRRQRQRTIDLNSVETRPASPVDGGIEDERIAALRVLIAEFDPLNRALMLLYLDDRSYREIADVLGITETNVATKLHRLKQRIRLRFPSHLTQS